MVTTFSEKNIDRILVGGCIGDYNIFIPRRSQYYYGYSRVNLSSTAQHAKELSPSNSYFSFTPPTLILPAKFS